MENTQTLLMMVLKQHFRERPQILDEALRVIKEYSNKESAENEYEKTLDTLREKMNDLPPDILQYFLSMVPLPKQHDEECKSSVIEEMKNTETTSCIRSKLVEYLNSKIPPLVPIKKDGLEVVTEIEQENELDQSENSSEKADFVPPKKKLRAKRKLSKTSQKVCKSLLDTCAEYVIKNQGTLTQYYKQKKDKVWGLVNSNRYGNEDLCALYEVLKDLNRKAKLMRMVLDCDEVPHELILEEYGYSDVFLKEKYLFEDVYDDPFVISNELNEAIINFIRSCLTFQFYNCLI